MASKSASDPSFGEPGAPFNQSHPFYFGFIAALGALTALTLMRAFASVSQVFVLLVVAMFLAMGLNPAVEAIRRRGLKRSNAVAVVFACVIGFVILFGYLVIPPIVSQSNQLIATSPELLNNLTKNPTIAQLNEQYGIIDTLQSKLQVWIKDGKFVLTAFGGIVGVGRSVLSGAFSALTIIVLTLYFLSSLPQITKIAYRLAPASRRERIANISDAIISRIGTFVGSQVSISALAAVVMFIVGEILRIPYATSIAMVVFVAALIPLVGHFIAGSIFTIVATAQTPTTGLIAFIIYVLYVQIENYIIAPRIMKRSLSIPGIVTIVSALIGTSLLGLVGGLLAVPVAAAVILILEEVVFPRAEKS